MSERFARAYHNVRNLVLGVFNRKFLIFLFFLVLSSVFWLMMTLNETYEQEISVPMSLTNVPDDVVITTDLDTALRVTVRDKGYRLIGYLYGDSVKGVKINFNAYANKTSEQGVVPSADLQKMAYRSLVNSSKIVSVAPDKVAFYFNYGLSKSVPVVMDGKVDAGRSYYLAQTRFWPRSVTVYANKQLLDSIKSVKTEPLQISNLTDTVIRDVNIAKKRGVKCVPSKVRIGLYPDILTEESMEVPIRAINVPEGMTMRMFPSRVKVKFVVGVGIYRNINAEQFDVVADYNEIANQKRDKCDISLLRSPVSVRSPQLEIKQVDYLIEQ